MRKITVETIHGFQKESVYELRELSLLRFLLDSQESQKRNVHYL